jgi:Cu(I)/Ag(I) efflux system membrane fusion protein
MKTKIMMLCLAVVSGAAFAQHDHGSGQSAPMHSKKEKETTHSHRAAPAFQKQLADVFMASLQLKEAFVSSDTAKVLAAIPEIRNSIAKVDITQLKDEALMDWMSYLKTLNESTDQISKSKDLTVQRKAFVSFSDALYESVKMFGVGGMPAYYTYCPMANNNSGAYWLSDSKEIRNPYFGDAMLTCGKVKETLQ